MAHGTRTRRLALALAITGGITATGCAGGAAHTTDDGARPDIPGYRFGDRALPPAPITRAQFEDLKKSLLFTEDDVRALRRSREVLEPHVEELVGVWYGFVGANPHLLRSFSNDAGTPDAEYLSRVRARFERWVLDTARAEYDDAWLAYQFEIGRRHHRVGKNATDNADAAAHIEFKHLIALTIPVTTTIRPFLERGGHSAEQVDAMHAAWVKSVLMQSILWSYPYVKRGDF